jgi:hypothetical protein
MVTAFHNLDLQCDDRDVAVVPGFSGNDLDASDKRARRIESTQFSLDAIATQGYLHRLQRVWARP